MKFLKMIGVGALVLFTMNGCATWAALKSDAGGVLAKVGDTFVPASVQAPIANGVAAAENFYTAYVNVLTVAVNKRAVTKTQSARLAALDNKVYDALVVLRTDAQAGHDVTAALDLFNAAYGKLYTEAASDGMVLPTTPPASPAAQTGGAP